MSKVIIEPKYLLRLSELDIDVRKVNEQKIGLLFEALGINLDGGALEKMLEWELIIVNVPDRQMAVQLNKLSAYIPNLKFVADATQPLFRILQGDKSRRFWKER